MSRRLTVWIAPQEIAVFETRLIGAGPCAMLADEVPTPTPVLLRPDAPASSAAPIVWLANPEDLGLVRFHAVAGRGGWAVDRVASPVIGLVRPAMVSGRLCPGLCSCEDGSGGGVARSREFLGWAERVFAAAKGMLRRDDVTGDWFSPAGEAWFRKA